MFEALCRKSTPRARETFAAGYNVGTTGYSEFDLPQEPGFMLSGFVAVYAVRHVIGA
jgi:hypothetical protein